MNLCRENLADLLPHFTVVGLSHQTAPLLLRERVAVVAAALSRPPWQVAGESLLLSTCNRTELYLGNSSQPASLLALPPFSALTPAEAAAAVYTKQGVAALHHLCRVAAGLDSMVVGETEILGQVRRAQQAAQAAGSAGPLLTLLWQEACRTAAEVHTRTALGRGHTSVSSVAVQLAAQLFPQLATASILVIGAGEVALATLKSLVEREAREIVVVNRSVERSAAMAGRFAARTAGFEALAELLPQADIVISATAAPHPVVRAAQLAAALQQRQRDLPLLLFDLAVPADIEPPAADGSGLHLYNLDSLQALADSNKARRHASIAAAGQIVQARIAALTGQNLSHISTTSGKIATCVTE